MTSGYDIAVSYNQNYPCPGTTRSADDTHLTWLVTAIDSRGREHYLRLLQECYFNMMVGIAGAFHRLVVFPTLEAEEIVDGEKNEVKKK